MTVHPQPPLNRMKSVSSFVFVPLVLLLACPALAAQRSARRPNASAVPLVQRLVPKGATWRYLDDGSNQGTAWRAPGFDDSSWKSGAAQFGYGDGDETTLISFGPNINQKFITTYFRRTFRVTDPNLFQTLSLKLVRDDGGVVYLNGQEVLRENLPPGTISASTQALGAVAEAAESAFRPLFVSPTHLVSGENTLAVEIHQTSPTSSDVSFDLELLASPFPIVTRGPYLQRQGEDRITVRWRSDLPTDSRVWFREALSNSPWTIAENPVVTTEHEVELLALQPDTLYEYAVGKGAQMLSGNDGEHLFRTSPSATPNRPIRIWALGDSGTATPQAVAVRDAFRGHLSGKALDLILLLGDNAYDQGNDLQFQGGLFDMYREELRRTVVWPTRGNHEMSASTYFDAFTLPRSGEVGGLPSGTEAYYSFDHGNAHFVCLASFGVARNVGGAMWTWLESDLATTDADWIIAFWHHPPYSKGSHDSDSETTLIQMRENFVPLLEDYGIDLVLSGHSHSYERSFLLDGHYDVSATLTPAMILDNGGGQPSLNGPYEKLAQPHAGAVYCVAGSAGKLSSGAPLDHPAMFHSVEAFGSVLIELEDDRLDLFFVDDSGAVNDSFRIIKSL